MFNHPSLPLESKFNIFISANIKLNLQSTTFPSPAQRRVMKAWKLNFTWLARQKKSEDIWFRKKKKTSSVLSHVPVRALLPFLKSNLACRFCALTNFYLIANINGRWEEKNNTTGKHHKCFITFWKVGDTIVAFFRKTW